MNNRLQTDDSSGPWLTPVPACVLQKHMTDQLSTVEEASMASRSSVADPGQTDPCQPLLKSPIPPPPAAATQPLAPPNTSPHKLSASTVVGIANSVPSGAAAMCWPCCCCRSAWPSRSRHGAAVVHGQQQHRGSVRGPLLLGRQRHHARRFLPTTEGQGERQTATAGPGGMVVV